MTYKCSLPTNNDSNKNNDKTVKQVTFTGIGLPVLIDTSL